MDLCWVNRHLILETILGMLLKSQVKVQWAIRLKEQLAEEEVISWEINHNLCKLQEVLKKDNNRTQIYIRLNNNNHMLAIISHLNRTQPKLVKWCIRHSRIILIWETAYSLEMEVVPMVSKALYIHHIM
jgi:hypothetical protein